jgi:hypothetical protein
MIICSYKIGNELINKKIDLMKNKFSKKEINCMKVMLSMNCLFLVCNLPYCIQKLVFDALSLFDITSDYRDLITGLTMFLVYIQNSCSFFVYLIFNKVFRNYFLSMIKLKA